jgi:hypothetical protein
MFHSWRFHLLTNAAAGDAAAFADTASPTVNVTFNPLLLLLLLNLTQIASWQRQAEPGLHAPRLVHQWTTS